MKILYLITVFLFYSSSSFSQIFESFNFEGALNANGWTTHSGANPGQFQVINSSSDMGASLSYPNLEYSSGNRSSFLAGQTEDVNKPVTGISGTGYYSFLMKVTNADTLPTTGVHFIGFGGASGVSLTSFAGRVYIKKGLSTNSFQLGLLNFTGGTPSPTPTYDSTEFTAGETLLIVVKLNNTTSPIQATLYVNPIPGSTEPVAFLESALGSSNFNNFASLYLRHGSGIRNLEIDEIRVGSTWASVTPVPCDLPAPNYQDLDADGFGNPDVVQFSCIPILGYVANNTDCNDNSNQVYPGANEILSNGIDENCDGLDGTLSLQENSEFSSLVYPNPNNGSFEIHFNTPIKKGILNLSDLSGKILISKQMDGSIYEFNELQLIKGLYLLTISSSLGSKIHRIVVN